MCTNGSSPLLGKFHLGDLVLNNKICMAPVTRARGNDGVPSELMMEYYKQRSAAGLIISEGCFVCESSRDPQTTGLVTEEMKYAWKQLVEITKKNNNKSIIFAQLWHAGRASHTSFRKDKSPSIAPSAKPITGKLIRTPTGLVPPEIPKELTITEIKEIIQAYKDAAEKALQAGFDGIEIHAANGYLIDTFLQGTTNQRTDIYGGSFENNFRFLRELIEELSSVFPIHRIGVRLSPNGNYNDMGTPDYNECFAYYLGELNKYNIAYVHILDGIAFGFHNYGPPFSLEKTRQYFHGTIMCNCGHSVEDAADIIAQNRADLVSFGRLFISNPDLVNRIRHNWPVNTQGLVRDDSWYSGGPVGYTDYPLFCETN